MYFFKKYESLANRKNFLMCGILCVWNKKESLQSRVLEKAVETYNHRGPDAKCMDLF